MADEDKDQRTEDPTEKKRGDSFKKGRTAKSKEVSSTIVLFAAVLSLYFFGGHIRENLSELLTTSFTTFPDNELTVDSMSPMLAYYLKMIAIILAPIMITTLLSGILVNIAQNGGFILTAEPMKPKLNKLDPIKGFGKFVSKQAFMDLFKSIFKIAIVATVCWLVVSSEWGNIPKLSDQNVEQVVLFIAWVAFKLMMYVLLITVFLAIVDFAFEKYQFEEGLKMTKQEVKDERKSTDGDPQTKARIRSAQLALIKRRMMADVPKAEVVITNPTHLAIAISYDRMTMAAPQVVAKGAGHVAERIKAIAKENDVPVVEDKPLARILFKTIGIGDAIPEEVFKAIAEILAYVYRLKGKELQNK